MDDWDLTFTQYTWTLSAPIPAVNCATKIVCGGVPRAGVARSEVPVETAYGQEYKITFVMDGKTIDPNMDCDHN